MFVVNGNTQTPDSAGLGIISHVNGNLNSLSDKFVKIFQESQTAG